jgi:CheY-like chemotaxis protein
MPPAASRPRAILVVETETRRHAVLAPKLRASGLEVWTAAGTDQALELLKHQVPGAIALAADLPAEQAASACHALAKAGHGAPLVLLTEDRSPELRVLALSAGAAQVIPAPASTREIVTHLELLLRRAETPMPQTRHGITRHAYVGRLESLGLIDSLEQMQAGRLSGIVRVRGTTARAGELFVSEGQVIDARAGSLAGTEAVYRMMGWREGTLEIDGCPVRRPGTVSTPLPDLILEGLRRREQWDSTLSEMPAGETVLEVDYQVLADRLASIPDEVNGVLRLCDSHRTITAVIDEAPFPDLASARIVARLLADGVLIEAAPAEAAMGVEGDLRARRIARWLGDETPAGQAHAGSPVLSLMEARSVDGRQRTFYPDTHADAPTPVGREPVAESLLAAAVMGGSCDDDHIIEDAPHDGPRTALLLRTVKIPTRPGWPAIADEPPPEPGPPPTTQAAVVAAAPPSSPPPGPANPAPGPATASSRDADRPGPAAGVIYVDGPPRGPADEVAAPNRPVRDTEVVRPLAVTGPASALPPATEVTGRMRRDEWTAETPPARRALVLAGLGAALGVGGALLLFLRSPEAPPPPAVAVPAAVVVPARGEVAPGASRSPPAPAPAADPAAPAAPEGAALATAAAPPATAAATGAAEELGARCRRAYARQRYAGIVQLCTEALEAAPDEPDLMAILAHAELDRGNYDRARKWARRALALEPRLAEAHAYLGFIEDQAGRRDAAMASYRAYLKLAPRGRYAEDIRAIVHSEP